MRVQKIHKIVVYIISISFIVFFGIFKKYSTNKQSIKLVAIKGERHSGTVETSIFSVSVRKDTCNS